MDWGLEMSMDRVKQIALDILAAAIGAAILLAQIPAAAFPRPTAPSIHKTSMRQPIAPGQPSIMIHQDVLREFEDVTGQTLTSSDLSNLQRIVDTVDQLNADDSEKPQKIRWDIGNSGYEFTILVCGHLKTQINSLVPQKVKDGLAKMPVYVKDKIQGTINRANVDLMPCFDPHTGVSYIMLGIGGSTSAVSPLSAGISIGIYFAPKSENMVVGEYLFGRASMRLGPFAKWDAITAGGDLRCVDSALNLATRFTVDFSKCNKDTFRAFISTGLSLDLGGSIISKLKAWKNRGKEVATPEAPDAPKEQEVDAGLWTFSGGVVVKMNEHPWYSRLRAGQSMSEAFGDIATYKAPGQ